MLRFLVETVIGGLLMGIVGNAVFLILLSRLRPKVDVASSLAVDIHGAGGIKRYRIKVINRTRSPVSDIRATLDLMERVHGPGGVILNSQTIEISGDPPIAIPAYSVRDADANYAYRFSVKAPIDELWTNHDNQFLRFRMTCRHTITGFGGFFVQDYTTRDAMVLGLFKKGNGFEVVASDA